MLVISETRSTYNSSVDCKRSADKPTEMVMITAIFVESDGCYQNDDRIDPWDIRRDAMKYGGEDGNAVIAHRKELTK